MAADSIRIFFWIVVLLINCVITPYEAYWVHKLMANRNKVIIQKRRPRLLFVSLLSIWIFGLLLLPIAALLDHIDGTIHDVVFMVNAVVTMPLYVAFEWITCCYFGPCFYSLFCLI